MGIICPSTSSTFCTLALSSSRTCSSSFCFSTFPSPSFRLTLFGSSLTPPSFGQKNHPEKTSPVRPAVTTQYSQIHPLTFFPSPGLNEKKLVLKNVATNVAGRKRSVMIVISRMSCESLRASWAISKERSASCLAISVISRLR